MAEKNFEMQVGFYYLYIIVSVLEANTCITYIMRILYEIVQKIASGVS